MLSEANEADKALPFSYLSQLGQVERTKFLVDQGEVPVSVWVDAWLRRAKLREFLKAKAKQKGDALCGWRSEEDERSVKKADGRGC